MSDITKVLNDWVKCDLYKCGTMKCVDDLDDCSHSKEKCRDIFLECQRSIRPCSDQCHNRFLEEMSTVQNKKIP
jgi:hypothetical protein